MTKKKLSLPKLTFAPVLKLNIDLHDQFALALAASNHVVMSETPTTITFELTKTPPPSTKKPRVKR